MEALIVSGSKQAFDAICGIVRRADDYSVTYADSGAGALGETERKEYDLIVVNSVSDMRSDKLAEEIALSGVGVILLCERETFEVTAKRLAAVGVLTVSKPLDGKTLFSAVTFISAANARVANVKNQNAGLKKKLDDVKIVDRAKMILMQTLGYNEQQAHKHIEKQAMELRLAKREIALNILKTYEV